jgi:hypothetical protein
MVADPAEVRRALGLFADPAAGCELMALRSGVHRTLPGSDADGLCAAAAGLPSGGGIYFRVNPVPPGLARPAKNGDVLGRRWLYIDVDPVKADEHKHDPATDEEKAATKAVCEAVNEYLAGHGWPAPVIADSGNGYGLFYRCDLPNDAVTQATFRRLLADLAARYSGPHGSIDKSVHNANRLAKLPGTWARKGACTDDRPHRPCRLVSVPKAVEAVTAGQLSAAAGMGGGGEPERPPGRPPSANGTHKAAGPDPAARYARRAMDAECARVILARPGGDDGRNNALNRAAFSLGQLVAGGALDRDEVEGRLYEAACTAGLDRDANCGERGIWSTIRSGLEAGREKPRGAPEAKADPRATFGGPKPADTGKPTGTKTDRLTVNLANVTPQKVEWLVKHRIPKRFITVFAGRTSVGKSCVAFDLISRLSNGGEIPCSGGLCFEPAGTLVISEDPVEYMIAPRLIVAGADMSRISAMTWEAMGKYHLGDTDMLERACAEVPGGVSVVYIDPPTNFLEGVDEHKNSEVRQLVMRVVEWAAGRDVACIFVLHVNKQTGKGIEALNRVMGSVAWVTTARVAHSFCNDPESPDQCLWVPLKNNIGPLPKALAYRIVGAGDAPKVEWIGEVDTTADEAMGHAEPRKRSVVAAQWLAAKFVGRDKVPSDDVWRAKDKETTLSRNALLEAKEGMGIRAKQEADTEGDRQWFWYWPSEARRQWEDGQGPAESR